MLCANITKAGSRQRREIPRGVTNNFFIEGLRGSTHWGDRESSIYNKNKTAHLKLAVLFYYASPNNQPRCTSGRGRVHQCLKNRVHLSTDPGESSLGVSGGEAVRSSVQERDLTYVFEAEHDHKHTGQPKPESTVGRHAVAEEVEVELDGAEFHTLFSSLVY